jgi:hypothetical protein
MHLEQQKDKIIKLYKNGESLRDISSFLCCSFSGIKRILHKYNINMRNKCDSLHLCPNNFADKELSLLIGTILGDGHLTKNKLNGESSLYIGHSVKQKEYIKYKYNILKRWIGCKVYSLFHKIGDTKYETLNFVTRRNKKITELRNLFYKENIKIVPFKYLTDNFDEYSLFIWYLDDGYNYKTKGCEFCSESFSEKENLFLIDLLEKKFKIKARLRKCKNKFRIYITKKDKKDFFKLIEKYMSDVETMRYKI